MLKSTQPLDVAEVSKAVADAHAQDRSVAFTQAQADGFALLAPALQCVFSSLAKERKPALWRDSKDPAATAEAFLKDSSHVAKGFQLQAAEEELQRLQSATLLFPESDPLHDVIHKKLQAAKDNVAKLAKEVPSRDLKTSCLEEVMAAYRRHVQTRRDRTQKGKDAAAARR